MKILKFGGTSVGSDENVRKISQIVEAQQTDIIVVVSALGGVTDQLLAMATAASSGNEFMPTMKEIKERHEKMIENLFTESKLHQTLQTIRPLFDDIEKPTERDKFSEYHSKLYTEAKLTLSQVRSRDHVRPLSLTNIFSFHIVPYRSKKLPNSGSNRTKNGREKRAVFMI